MPGADRLSRRLLAGVLLIAVAGLAPWAWDRAHEAPRHGAAGYDYQAAPSLTGWDDPRVTRRAGEPTVDYVRRANAVVSAAVYHCTPGTDQTWSMSILSRISTTTREEGILDPSQLRCGFCSQSSFVLAQILQRNDVPSAAGRDLRGHVVVTFEADGQQYVVGADRGVGPFVVHWGDGRLLRHEVARAYARFGDATVRTLQPIFSDPANDVPQHVAMMEALAAGQHAFAVMLETVRWSLLALAGWLVLTGIARGGPARRPRISPGLTREVAGPGSHALVGDLV